MFQKVCKTFVEGFVCIVMDAMGGFRNDVGTGLRQNLLEFGNDPLCRQSTVFGSSDQKGLVAVVAWFGQVFQGKIMRPTGRGEI